MNISSRLKKIEAIIKVEDDFISRFTSQVQPLSFAWWAFRTFTALSLYSRAGRRNNDSDNYQWSPSLSAEELPGRSSTARTPRLGPDALPVL
ncbi:MAG: hypothetical protein LC768_10660 [Acidobacteria bacterium]|nr:hypothetical protein [Acidobacteriota bacterium]MCA1638775.1 hypothetical protein [Acidobacteriota bacterium]